MNTRPSNPTGSSFPTCGEVYQYVVNHFDLLTWSDAFWPPDKRSAKKLSNQLSVWAKEKDGISARGEFTYHLGECMSGMPSGKRLTFFLSSILDRLLDTHGEIVLGETTFLPADETRHWYAKRIAPNCLFHFYVLQMLLRRVAPLSQLLQLAPDQILDLLAASESETPLTLWCLKQYEGSENLERQGRDIDPHAIRAWEQGRRYPRIDSLSLYFAGYEHKEPLVLDFAYARLLEKGFRSLTETLKTPQEREVLCANLIAQAECLKMVEDHLEKNSGQAEKYSDEDYLNYIAETLDKYFKYMQECLEALDQGQCILNVNDQFDYYRRYTNASVSINAPERFKEFAHLLQRLESASRLDNGAMLKHRVELKESLSQLREAFPDYSEILAGPLLAIEARLTFSNAKVAVKQRLEDAYHLYLDAAEASRYRAGAYTKRIYSEALGVSAILLRRGLGKGSIRPQISRLLAWWDLLKMGDDYRHEHENRRVEKAEGRFMDMISEAHRELLRSELPDVVIPTRLFGGMMSLRDPNHPDIADSKVPRKQKRPVNNTALGRDTSPLMLVIENGQLDYARELLNAGKDYLNFINTEGDTAITKAFAAKDFELVMLILQREAYPVKLETLQRVTDKKKNSPLERAVAYGRPEILRALANYGPGNRAPLEMDGRSCCFGEPFSNTIEYRTPLYNAIRSYYEVLSGISLVTGFINPFGTADEILSAIDCLVDEIGVKLDVPNHNDHSALTLCAELGLTDLAIKLLGKGANPNHRFSGGGTALCCAIKNDDIRLASALSEFDADYTLYIDSLGRPIYTMSMSDQLRGLIPYRIG